MAWLLVVIGAGLVLWGLAGLRAHDRRLGTAEERLGRLAEELASAGEAVLQAADGRLAELEAAVAAADRRLAALAAPGGPGAAPAAHQAGPLKPEAGGEPTMPSGDEAAALDAGLQPEPAPPQHRAVWRLADAGREEAAIVQETGLLAGEVRLILGLRRLTRR